MVHFILNNEEVSTALPSGMTLLDFIRYRKHLTGTKIGCREGDCGACTILVGEIKKDQLIYTSATSCLMALGNAQGKHIVTIEGINIEGLNAVQQAFSDEAATQCGFCTPGFVVSLTGFCISGNTGYENAIHSVNGNICRCTGYKSIERAAHTISNLVAQRNDADRLQFAVDHKMIPAYFLAIRERIERITVVKSKPTVTQKRLGGGTDLYVQQHEAMEHSSIEFLFDRKNLNGIKRKGSVCEMGAAVTVADIAASAIFQSHFTSLQKYIALVSSTQIRNMATIAGNFINASPIGDLTIFFLALNAKLELTDGKSHREMALRDLYKGYKLLDKTEQEMIEKISFELPGKNDLFNFEKVSKRTNLDIASVNSAIHLVMDGDEIVSAGIAAGGVGPVPLYLSKSSSYIQGKRISASLIDELVSIAQSEISPISDARGTEKYKRLLLSQLIKAHFISLFPSLPLENIIITA
ncbi:MAG: FAD binding domain-containing protein [Bacteroidetes bacterium]|nr:FAD binding domain-containing protein [Bacteroidota bacterium]